MPLLSISSNACRNGSRRIRDCCSQGSGSAQQKCSTPGRRYVMAKEEILYSGVVENIAALIEACQFPEVTLTLFLAETLPQRVIEDSERRGLLVFAYFNKKIPFAAYT